jgi:hypothetical protein
MRMRELIARAAKSGHGQEVLAAIKEIDSRLRFYPQFGEPLFDLNYERGQVWIGTVHPLVVRYVLYEERRLVAIGEPVAVLPNSGF